MSAQLSRPGPYAGDDQEPDAYYIAYSGYPDWVSRQQFLIVG